jgi:hypothetical protein
MTTAEIARRLLSDAAGEALCDSCLAFACSVSLIEMRHVTEELASNAAFQRRDRCVSCRRTVSAICFAAKCVQCSRPVLPGDNALVADGDILHAACFRLLVSDETLRISKRLTRESQRLIEDARRQTARQHARPHSTAGDD